MQLKPIQVYHLLCFVLLAGINLALNLSCCAQYRLPKHQILADHSIQSISITKTPLYYQYLNGSTSPIDSAERVPQRIIKYFINPNGQIDSIYHFPNDTGYYKKDVVKYNSEGKLSEIIHFASDDKVQKRELLEKTPENDWHYKLWEYGHLKYKMKATSDSITFESIRYHDPQNESNYSISTFDLENDIRIDATYHGDELQYQQRYQWITENGIPTRFLFSSFERGEGKKKPKKEEQDLKMDENGMVMNKRNGTIFDPFRMHGYYDRHLEFRGIRHLDNSYFKEDSLIKAQEVSELFTFDGTEIVYLYEIDYTSAPKGPNVHEGQSR